MIHEMIHEMIQEFTKSNLGYLRPAVLRTGKSVREIGQRNRSEESVRK